ncbi:ATP-binding protein [Paenibacillus massiliensis]|uniref:ATP-binding protein n=1 Tax=Paenibacillus massiliensis TaxID=225917 RepID=UPI000564CBAC|nr:ATP-binding protein [Paenibacillus massiliensis]
MNDYILFTGIHGAGKSFLTAELKKSLEFDVYAISDLIRKAGTRIDSANKNTSDPLANQILWKKELNDIKFDKKFLVLDGHFCLLDKSRSVIVLPEDTFLGTKLKKIVLITHEPSVIKDRLFKRDGVDYPLELINDFQQSEINAASNFSEKYKIPLFGYHKNVSITELVKFINY